MLIDVMLIQTINKEINREANREVSKEMKVVKLILIGTTKTITRKLTIYFDDL